MLIIDTEEKYDNPIIQENWRNGKVPHFSGIVIGNGVMVVMGEQNYKIGNDCQTYVFPVVESNISSFLEFSGDFVELTEMAKRAYIPEINCYAICGEGQMGNEGFVALVKDNFLIWVAFFTISNPFYEVKINETAIIAKSTHDVIWEFPIFEPWKVNVSGKHVKE